MGGYRLEVQDRWINCVELLSDLRPDVDRHPSAVTPCPFMLLVKIVSTSRIKPNLIAYTASLSSLPPWNFQTRDRPRRRWLSAWSDKTGQTIRPTPSSSSVRSEDLGTIEFTDHRITASSCSMISDDRVPSGMFIRPKPLARKRSGGAVLFWSLKFSNYDYVYRSLNLVWISLTPLFSFGFNPVHIAVSEKWRPRLDLVGLVVLLRYISTEKNAFKVSHSHHQHHHLPSLSIIITGFDSLLHSSLSVFKPSLSLLFL